MLNPCKKTILILVDWFYPGYRAGGPIQSCLNLSLALKKEYNIRVVTSDTDHGETNPYKNIRSEEWNFDIVPGIGIYYMEMATFTPKRIRMIIEDINPEWVYLNHMFSPYFVVYPLWLKWRNLIQAKIVLCPRGALFQSALDMKPLKKKLFLWLIKNSSIPEKINFHATNEREKKAILNYFPNSSVSIADNLPKLEQPKIKPLEKIKGFLSMIYVGRIHPIKNLERIILDLKRVRKNVVLSIAGPIEDESYWLRCQELIKELPLNVQVKFLGPIPNEFIDGYIQRHHLFVLPTLGENFGHAILESLLIGRPVLISDQTPWKALKKNKAGWDVNLNDNDSLVEAVNSASAWGQEEFDEYAQNAWQVAKNFIEDPSLINSYYSLFQ